MNIMHTTCSYTGPGFHRGSTRRSQVSVMPGTRSLILGQNSKHKTFKLRLVIEELALFRTHFTSPQAKDQSIHVDSNSVDTTLVMLTYLALIWYRNIIFPDPLGSDSPGSSHFSFLGRIFLTAEGSNPLYYCTIMASL